MKELLYRPKPYRDESLSGYLTRLTEENMYEKVSWIYEKAGLVKKNFTLINSKEHSLDHLSRITDISKKKLWQLTFFNELGDDYESDKSLYNTLSYKYGTNSIYSNICPFCLKKNNYVRKIWDLNIYLTCHYHNVILIDKCAKCGSKIPHYRSNVSKCKCGFDFKESVPIKISSNDVELSKLLYSKMFDYKIRSNSQDALHLMEIKYLICLIMFISGRIHLNNFKQNIDFKSSPENKDYYLAIQYSYRIFSKWPYSFIEFLEDYRVNPKDNRNSGVKTEFGSFYTGLYEKFTHQQYNFLRNEFENYLIKYWNGGHLKKLSKINSKINKTPSYISGYECEKYYC